MKKLMIITATLLLSGSLFAQNFKTEDDTVAYLLGVNMAQNVMGELQELNLSEAFLIKGFSEYKTCSFSQEQINAILQEYFMKKQKAEQDKAKDQCTEKELKNQEFFNKNKNEKGIITLENGLQYKVVSEGSSSQKPTMNDNVVVHYKGSLLDGTIFDSSFDRGEPATFPVNAVIPGFSQIIQLMTVGSTYIAYIPSELGYGISGAGSAIEPCSALIFEIQLVAIQSDNQQIENETTKTQDKDDKKAKKSKK